MFGIFKKTAAPPLEHSFKHRVEQFWAWYAHCAKRFHAAIDDGHCATLANEVSDQVEQLGPGFAWVFGPGKENGHSFTLSGEGILHKQLLTQYWLSLAPEIAGWTFYSERQPGSIEGIQIKIDDHDFDPIEFWITPLVDDENERVHITAWHPLFDKLNQQQALTTLFLFLDEVLGEFGTELWIGEIKLNNQKLCDSIPLKELSGFMLNLQNEKSWKKFLPGKEVTLYRIQNPHDRFLRGDVVVGNTANSALLNEYLKAEGNLNDPLAGTGADYIFVTFNAEFLPVGNQSAVRGQIEDSLNAALQTEQSGRILGGALGRRFAYIDLMIYDGQKSLEIVKHILREHKLPAGTAIQFFASEKRTNSLVI